MKGLLYKEYCMFKPQFRSWVFVLLFFIAYGIIFKNSYMFIMMIAILGLMSCFNSFTYDKQYRCDEYLAAMPVSRKELVWSKYIFMLFLDLMLTIATLIMVSIYTVWAGESVLDLLVGAGSTLMVTVLMQAILMPIVYIMGIDRARYVNIAIWMIPWALFMLFHDKLPRIEEEMIFSVLKIVPFLAVILMVVSVCISTSVFRKKDL